MDRERESEEKGGSEILPDLPPGSPEDGDVSLGEGHRN